MAVSQRIKGQEVQVLIVKSGQLQATLTDILDFNVEMLLETKVQGYLGETTNRHDDIYNGVKFDLEMHLHTGDWFDFQSAIIDRARRVTPDVQFNIVAACVFPDGEERTITVSDAKFGAQPLNISQRGDYVKVKLEGMANEYTQVAA